MNQNVGKFQVKRIIYFKRMFSINFNEIASVIYFRIFFASFENPYQIGLKAIEQTFHSVERHTLQLNVYA